MRTTESVSGELRKAAKFTIFAIGMTFLRTFCSLKNPGIVAIRRVCRSGWVVIAGIL